MGFGNAIGQQMGAARRGRAQRRSFFYVFATLLFIDIGSGWI